MEHIGFVKSVAQAHRAIKFLARLSCTPISFFGHQPVGEPYDVFPNIMITYDKERHSFLFNQNKIGVGMGAENLVGALDAWITLTRRPKSSKRTAKIFKPIIEPSLPEEKTTRQYGTVLTHQEMRVKFPSAWNSRPLFVTGDRGQFSVDKNNQLYLYDPRNVETWIYRTDDSHREERDWYLMIDG